MAYTYAVSIKDELISNLTQFEGSGAEANLGVGFAGWDNSIAYARSKNLPYFGSVYLVTGDESEPKAFGYGMWNWMYYVRMHVRFDKEDATGSDQRVMELADDFMDAMLDSTVIKSIAPTGFAKVVSANYLSEPEVINDVTYLTLEFLIQIREQIER